MYPIPAKGKSCFEKDMMRSGSALKKRCAKVSKKRPHPNPSPKERELGGAV